MLLYTVAKKIKPLHLLPCGSTPALELPNYPGVCSELSCFWLWRFVLKWCLSGFEEVMEQDLFKIRYRTLGTMETIYIIVFMRDGNVSKEIIFLIKFVCLKPSWQNQLKKFLNRPHMTSWSIWLGRSFCHFHRLPYCFFPGVKFPSFNLL
jgi:hypothetical protein